MSESESNSWVVGVALSVTASTFSCLGVNIQKLVHTKVSDMQGAGDGKPVAFHTLPLWWAGMVLIMLGSSCDLLSYGFADLSLLAPLGSITMITNLAVAPCITKSEVLTRWDVICTAIIFTGVMVAIAFGSKSNTEYTLEDLLELYVQIPVYAMFAVFASLAVTVRFIYVRFLAKEQAMLVALSPSQSNVHNPATLPVAVKDPNIRESGLVMAKNDVDTDTDTVYDSVFEQEEKNTDYKLLRFLLPTTAGMFGSCSALCGKSLAELATNVFDGDFHELTRWEPYALVVCMAVFLIMQVRVLNAGLSIATALYIVPVYQVMWSLANITVGLVYFQEYKTIVGISQVMFPLGIFIIFTGMYLLSHPQTMGKPEFTRTESESQIDPALLMAAAYDDQEDPEFAPTHLQPPEQDTHLVASPLRQRRRKKKKRQSVLISGGLRSSLVFDALKSNRKGERARTVSNSRRSVIATAKTKGRNNNRAGLLSPVSEE